MAKTVLSIKMNLSNLPGPEAAAETFCAVLAAVVSGGAEGEIHARTKAGADVKVASFKVGGPDDEEKAPAMPRMIGFMTSGGVC